MSSRSPLLRFLFLIAASLVPCFSAAQVFTEFTPPTAGGPFTITLGPDGALWFTEFSANKIGRVTTSGGFTEFTVPTASSQPNGIVTGPDGALWFVEFASVGNKVGRLTTAGVFTEFPIPTAGSIPQGITLGPDGNLWFAESVGNKIARITPLGVITEFPLPTGGSNPRRVTAGPDGAVWFTEAAGRIGRIQTGSPNTITEFTVPTAGGSPFDITTGADGALWFTEANVPKIGRITTAGVITEFPVNGQPLLIAAGHDGALYFGEGSGNKVGRITTTGVYADYSPPTASSSPTGIVAGLDGAMWFTEAGNGKIGRMFFDNGRLANISTRGEVLTGGDVMIAGFIIQGNTPRTVVVNVAGPSLAAFGISNYLQNPTLTVVRSSDNAVLGSNDDWQTQSNPADVAAIQATGFQPNNALEPAVILTLPPGAYTAIVQGVGGGTGVGLVGMFLVP